MGVVNLVVTLPHRLVWDYHVYVKSYSKGVSIMGKDRYGDRGWFGGWILKGVL